MLMMKHNGIRSLFMTVIALLVISLLSGCTDTKDRTKVNGENTPPQPVELVFYSLGNATEESFNEMFGDPIREKYPHFTIKYVRRGGASIDGYISSLLVSGTSVDINFDSIGNIPSSLLKYDYQYDMTELVKKHNLDLNRLEASAVEGMRAMASGKLFGIPVFSANRLLFYNKDIFDKFGVAYPVDNMSWDDAIALGRKLTRVDNGVQYVGLSSSKEHHIRMNALSVPLIDPRTGKPTINTDSRWRTIFAKGFSEIYGDSDYKQTMKGFPTRDDFYSKKTLAMMVYLSFLPANEPEPMSKMNWDMVSEPYYKELAKVSSQVYPTYFSITSNSKHKDEALQAIQVLLTKEHQTKLSRQGQLSVLNDPEVKKLLGQDTVFKDKNWKSIFENKFAAIPPKTLYDVDIEKIYLEQTLEYAKGTVDLNTLLRKAEEEANKLLESSKK